MKMDAQLASASVLSVDHTVTVLMVNVFVMMAITLMLCQIVSKVKFLSLNRLSKEKTHVKSDHLDSCFWDPAAQFQENVICTYFISLHLDCPPCDEHSHCDDTTDGVCICDEGYIPDPDSKCVKGMQTIRIERVTIMYCTHNEN